MVTEILRGIVLGVVQGITEFFPISSSGHLILIPRFFGWEDQGFLFDTMLHAGTLVALLWIFRADIVRIVLGVFRREAQALKEALFIVVATVPGLAFGFFFGDQVENAFRGAIPVAINLCLWGAVLWLADRFSMKQNRIGSVPLIGWRRSFAIGCSQALAFFPGTSRSGITATTGLFLGLDRATAVRFSFLVSIPTVCAAAAYGALKVFTGETSVVISPIQLIAGFLSAVFAGAWAIRFLQSYVSKHSFTPFVIYRFALALVVLLALR